MPSDFFSPPIEAIDLILIDDTVLRSVEKNIEACEACSEDADIPFDWVLDRMTGHDPCVTDYLLERPAKCQRCFQLVAEKTLVEAA